jgi:hypothetical protein
VRRAPITSPFAIDVAPLDEGFVVLAPAIPDGAWTIARVSETKEESAVTTSDLREASDEAIVAGHEGRWWFSRLAVVSGAPHVDVIASRGAEVTRQRVPLPHATPILWLPLRGDEPAGIVLSRVDDRTLYVAEVTSSGVVSRGSFDWPSSQAVLIPSRRLWSAERLPDGRIAVVSIETVPNSEQRILMLRIVGGETIVETALERAEPVHDLMAIAIDAKGRLAIVGLTQKGEVAAAIVDVVHPETTRCRVISAVGEIAARRGMTSVIAGERGFIAGWIRDDGTVRATEIRELRSTPAVVNVGDGADIERPLPRLMQIEDEQIVFVWRDRTGEVLARRVPQALNGYAFLVDLLHRLCSLSAMECASCLTS